MATVERRQVQAVAGEQKRPDLQGMRAVAVLSVFAGHLFHWPPGGFVGVDIFFVLSGFFITGILIRERTSTGDISFREFYTRRIRRIIPSALLVLAVTTIAAHFLLPATRAKDALIDALYAAVFASNWRFQHVGTDYFAADKPPSPVLHYWSLSIEEQFYFVWPVLLLGLFHLTRRYSTRREKYPQARRVSLAIAMGSICVASFAYASWQLAAGYFNTFTRIWELGIGALLAIITPLLGRLPNQIRPWLSYLGLAGVAASLFLISEATPFPGPWTLLPVLSTAVVVTAFVGAPVEGVPHLTNRVSDWFGDTSYTLYLWHWPILILLTAVFPVGLTYYIVVVIVALILTALTYRFYEDPIRKSNWLSSSRIPGNVWALIGGAAVAGVVLALIAVQTTTTKVDRWREPANLAAPTFANTAPPPAGTVITPDTAPLPGKGPCYGAPAIMNPQCKLRTDQPLTPSIDAFTEDNGSPNCWTPRGTPLHSCTYGYTGPDAIPMALVGDSHAQRMLVALAPYLKAMKWRLTTYLGWGCAWIDPPEKDCAQAMPEIQRQLIAQRYKLVITTAMRAYNDAENYIQAWKPVVDAGSRIAVIGDNPTISEESLNCLTRVGGDISTCGTSRADGLLRDDPLIAAAAAFPNAATMIDLTRYYCTKDRCPSVIGDVIVYSDYKGSHLTASYISTLGPAIVDGVRQALR